MNIMYTRLVHPYAMRMVLLGWSNNIDTPLSRDYGQMRVKRKWSENSSVQFDPSSTSMKEKIVQRRPCCSWKAGPRRVKALGSFRYYLGRSYIVLAHTSGQADRPRFIAFLDATQHKCTTVDTLQQDGVGIPIGRRLGRTSA